MTEINIGISTRNARIEKALLKHGITPVFFDDFSASNIDQLHGIVITGNKYDVPPAFYGEAPHPQTLIEDNSARLDLEIELINEAFDRSIPLLGICGGAQLLNVVFGGTLTQHLPDHDHSAIEHRQEAGTYHQAAHGITITAGTLLHRITGERVTDINSDHHQAIAKLGKGLVVSSTAHDGTIEGIEHHKHPFLLGVQWHPEYDASPIDSKVFSAFSDAARVKFFTSQNLYYIQGGHHATTYR